MRKALQLIRSVVFIAQMYLALAVIGIGLMPLALASRARAQQVVRLYCRWVVVSARWIVGLRTEVRGPIPEGSVIVASKHQSFFDILILGAVLPRASFIMKQELARMPVLGWYARRIGCVAVDRGKRSAAIKQMMDGVSAQDGSGQLVIYPQGTRVPPGARRPYKVGAGQLYLALGRPVVPVATNVGLFWPKRSLMRHPGVAVIEFLPVIPPGLDLRSFMTRIESEIEEASDRYLPPALRQPPLSQWASGSNAPSTEATSDVASTDVAGPEDAPAGATAQAPELAPGPDGLHRPA